MRSFSQISRSLQAELFLINHKTIFVPGVLVVDGPLWVEQRRFILRHLRDLGFGKTDMTVLIEDESKRLVEYWRDLIARKNVGSKEDRFSQIQDNIMNNNFDEKAIKANGFHIKELEKSKDIEPLGMIVEMENFFGVPVLNTLWRMMAGKRYYRPNSFRENPIIVAF